MSAPRRPQPHHAATSPAAHNTEHEPATRLIRFTATDGLPLAGLLYEPGRRLGRGGSEDEGRRRAIVWLHGTGGASVFESKRTNVLAAALMARGLAFFPFNNRGAHLVTRSGGMAHERIRDCVFDIDGAVRELRQRGYDDLTLAGHSTGANKVAIYDRYAPRNRIKRYILLAGGDDTGMLYRQLGPRRFAAALEKARTMIATRRGAELVPPRISPMPLSWRSFFDMANPRGDYNVFPFAGVGRFRHLRSIRKPSLYVYGADDEYIDDLEGSMRLLEESAGPRSRIVVLPGADHGFSDREEELAGVMAEWIARAPKR